MEYEYPVEIQNTYRSKGMLRAECERKLLLALFHGHSRLVLRHNLDEVIYLSKECDLDRYVELTKADVDNGYMSLVENGKFYFRLFVALDALADRGLVSSQLNFTYGDDPFEKPFHMEGKPGDFGRALVARALISSEMKDKEFGSDVSANKTKYLHSVQYGLTEKGYDVALIFFKHQDETRRFEQQAALNREAVNTSQSARNIARIALAAAIAIAIGSLGSLGLNIYQALCQP